MAEKLRVIEQDGSVIVLGTDQIREAADFAGLDNDKGIYWEASTPGLLVRRDKRWVFRSDYMPPKDAKPGVMFSSVRRPAPEPTGASVFWCSGCNGTGVDFEVGSVPLPSCAHCAGKGHLDELGGPVAGPCESMRCDGCVMQPSVTHPGRTRLCGEIDEHAYCDGTSCECGCHAPEPSDA